MRRLYVSLSVLILLPVLLVIAIYAATPHIVQWGSSRWLTGQGFEDVVLDMERPSWNQLRIRHFSAHLKTDNGDVNVAAGPLTIAYSPLTLWARRKVDLVELPQSSLQVRIARQAPDVPPQAEAYLDLPSLLPAVWFALLPSKQVRIGELRITLDYPDQQPDWTLTGALFIDERKLYSRVRFHRDSQELGWSDLELTPDNHFNFRILQADTPFVVIDGKLSAEERVTLRARQLIDLKGFAAWLERFMPTLNLPALAGSVSTKGRFTLPRKSALSPEGMIRQLEADHSFETQSAVTGLSTGLPDLRLAVAGDLRLADGRLALSIDKKSTAQAAPVVLPNVSLARADLVLDKPVHSVFDLKRTAQGKGAAPVLTNLPILGSLQLSAINLGEFRAAVRPIQLSVDSADLVQHLYKGSLTVPEVSVSNPHQRIPNIALAGRFNLAPGNAETRFDLAVKGLPLRATGRTTTYLEDGRTDLRWKLDTVPLKGLDRALRGYLRQFPAELSILSGTLDHNGQGSIRNGKLSLRFWNALNDGRAVWNKTSVDGVFWQSSGRYFPSGLLRDRGSLKISTLVSGVEVEEIESRYGFRQTGNGDRSIALEQLTARLLGGDIRIDGFTTALQPPDIATSVTVEKLEVSEILKLEQQRGLSGSGFLSGRFPLRYTSGGASVANGHLSALPPGGAIRFQPDEAVAAYAASNPGLAMALGALENFQYDTLDIKLNYQPDGTALLKTRLKGHNPDWNNGHPVDFTINVEENIPDLIRTLQFADQLTEKLERRYRD